MFKILAPFEDEKRLRNIWIREEDSKECALFLKSHLKSRELARSKEKSTKPPKRKRGKFS